MRPCEHRKHSDYNGYDYCHYPGINGNAFCPPVGCGAKEFIRPGFCEGADLALIISARRERHIDAEQSLLEEYSS